MGTRLGDAKFLRYFLEVALSTSVANVWKPKKIESLASLLLPDPSPKEEETNDNADTLLSLFFVLHRHND